MTRATDAFADRRAAGVALARAVCKLKLRPPVTVLGLPRGGVPVAFPIARALGAPLDVLVVRKIGMPGQPEFAIGAIATGGIVVHEPHTRLSTDVLGVPFEQLASEQDVELRRRERLYRGDAGPLQLAGRTVVLVDDGLATGCTMLAAIRAARKARATRVIVATPVASEDAIAIVGDEADDIVVLKIPADLIAIGCWYQNFEQVEDAEVCALLETRHESLPHAGPRALRG